jgi:hypothetical protein
MTKACLSKFSPPLGVAGSCLDYYRALERYFEDRLSDDSA